MEVFLDRGRPKGKENLSTLSQLALKLNLNLTNNYKYLQQTMYLNISKWVSART